MLDDNENFINNLRIRKGLHHFNDNFHKVMLLIPTPHSVAKKLLFSIIKRTLQNYQNILMKWIIYTTCIVICLACLILCDNMSPYVSNRLHNDKRAEVYAINQYCKYHVPDKYETITRSNDTSQWHEPITPRPRITLTMP